MNESRSHSVFDTDPPNLSETEVLTLLNQYYCIEAKLKPLVSERDQNFLVSTDRANLVLKIANVAEDPLIIESQIQALVHLKKTQLKESVPNVITGCSGETLYHYQSSQGVHCIRLLSYLDGGLYSQVEKSPDLFEKMGNFLGKLSQSLAAFGHPGTHRDSFLWNLDEAVKCKEYLSHIEDDNNRAMLAQLFERYETHVLPRLDSCRGAVIHNDVNDNNIIVFSNSHEDDFGLIDFGDLCYGRQINELAVAMAYVLQGEENLYAASQQIVGAYHQQFQLQDNELDVLFDLIIMRLVMSVCISSKRAKSFADNDYLRVSQKPAFDLLWRLQAINPAFMTVLLRQATGMQAVKNYRQVVNWLSSPQSNPAPLFDLDLKTASRRVIKLDKTKENARVEHFSDLLTKQDKENNINFLIGLYGEDRDVYRTGQFASVVTPERRTMHLGLDVFIEANTALYAPLAGRVYSHVDNNLPLDYGPTVILEHDVGDSGLVFYTLYGHLSHSTFDLLSEGQDVEAGQLIGHVGEFSENGGWAPHLHFQIMTTMLDLHGNFHGVAEKSLWSVWQQICPHPNLITRLAAESFDVSGEITELIEKRQRVLGPSLSLSYRNKLNIVRGSGAYLYDQTGRQFLDCVNNICHVGHCHPHVVNAMEQQARLLNTNTRYLHKTILDYSQRISDLLPSSMSVVFFVNSGTEANELALRIARTATGVKDTIVLDWGYHGNSGATVEISPYKFKRKGGFTKPEFVEIAEFPNPFSGRFKGMHEDTGLAYAQSVSDAVSSISKRTGHGPAAFIAESISGVGGQVVYPDGYLAAAYESIRASGGLCIADEVQCGFGRVGSHFWAFELQDVVPDIVVLGKPIGNGHPMAAVVTTSQLAKKFANGMEYFNSFGGNPVSMAVGMAVLDVIENEGLVQNAKNTGDYLFNRFNLLRDKYNKIGDVRGHGFFLGIELVKDLETLEPDAQLASDIVNDLRENAVLLSTDGPYDNVLKFKPPMVLTKDDADFLIKNLDASLARFH